MKSTVRDDMEIKSITKELIYDLASKLKDPQKVQENVLREDNLTLWGKVIPWDPLTLSHGFPGTILFYSELSKVFPNEKWDYVAHEHILYTSNYLREGVRSFSLFGGLSGVAFAVNNASKEGERYQSLLKSLDKVVVDGIHEIMDKEKRRQGLGASTEFYDVIQGVSGIGRYILDRHEQTNIYKSLLESILHCLVEMTKPILREGTKIPGWYISSDNQFLEKDKINYPNGNFNLGLAHGILGPLSLMALCNQKGIEVPFQRESMLIIGDWLLKNMKTDQNGYPIWPHRLSLEEAVSERFNPFDEREGWCYGNQGVARALYLTGRALNNHHYINTAKLAFTGIINRTKEQRNLESPTFCHGKSGLLQVLIRMKREAKMIELAPLIHTLSKDLINEYDSESPFGFKDVEIYQGKRNKLFKVGLLEGSTGAGLALLSLISSKEPEWDKAFLIS